jgi:16S rRNA (cytosine1402-N4)-methyltransferase
METASVECLSSTAARDADDVSVHLARPPVRWTPGTMTTGGHEPVMRAEVVRHLLGGRASEALRMVDVTLGAGGHAAALLAASPAGSELLGLDRDARAHALAAERLSPSAGRFRLRRARFSELGRALAESGWSRVDVVLADLGVSSMQLDDAERGFSFRFDASLDMRMDRDAGESAVDLLARISEAELAQILAELGEMPRAHRIARSICRGDRPRTTAELRERVIAAVGRPSRHHDPATLVFQALRIAVNDELGELEAFLDGLPSQLAPGARVVVLAYHSLEDRLVKRRFASWTASCVCPPEVPVCVCGGTPRARRLSRGAERPDEAEVLRNPRARSARLRAIEWLASARPDAGIDSLPSARRGDR